jgi:hypothetical protein
MRREVLAVVAVCACAAVKAAIEASQLAAAQQPPPSAAPSPSTTAAPSLTEGEVDAAAVARYPGIAMTCGSDLRAGAQTCPAADSASCLRACVVGRRRARAALAQQTITSAPHRSLDFESASRLAQRAAEASVSASEPPIPMDEQVRYNEVAADCAALRITQGLEVCRPLSPRDRAFCVRVCSDADIAVRAPDVFERALHDLEAIPSPPRAAPSAPSAPSPPAPTRRVRPPDPFQEALGACVSAVLQSGAPPVCHFARPLDDMDFGQRHCDERCAGIAGVARR